MPGKTYLYLICAILLPALSVSVAAAQVPTVDTRVLDEIQIFEKFGNIPEEEFSRSDYEAHPYYFLLKETSVRFEQRTGGIVALIDYLVRIRVNSDDPIRVTEAALVGIPYYFSENMESVFNLEGYTHSEDGTRNYFSGDDATVVDLNSRYKILEFQMPNVAQGSVIEYKYTLVRRYIEELPDFQISHRVPVREAVIYLKNEDYMRYHVVEENIVFDLNYTEARVDTSSIPMVFTFERPDPVFIQIWRSTNVPAADASAYVSSSDDIRGKLKFQISEFGIPRQPLENSWDFVAAQIQKSVNPFKTLGSNSAFLSLGDSLYRDIKSLNERIDSLFRYVNSRVEFNGSGAVFAEGNLSHVMEGEPSNQAEINMVLLALLKGAGIESNPLYISGRDFGRINKSFPSLYQFNRMLVVARGEEGEWRFMDASYSHSLPDLIPVESYNEQGMILSENDYRWVEIAPDRSIFDLQIDLNAELSEDGSLFGELKAYTRGYPSRTIRRDLSVGRPYDEIVKELFFESYPDAVIKTASVRVDELNRDLSEIHAEFFIPDYSATFTEGIEFRPMVVGYLFRNPFESAERRVPITLDAPESLSINYTIILPEGYRFETAGETRTTSLRGAELVEEYLLFNNRIEYLFDIEISRKEFPAEAYAQLRRMYERWVSLSNDTWFIENTR